MTKKKLPSIGVDPATYAALQEYATSSGLAPPDLVKRTWSLWTMLDQAHGALFPHQLAGENCLASQEKFLAEMQLQADMLDEDYLTEESESTQDDNE